jgi:hypothetical protein
MSRDDAHGPIDIPRCECPRRALFDMDELGFLSRKDFEMVDSNGCISVKAALTRKCISCLPLRNGMIPSVP